MCGIAGVRFTDWRRPVEPDRLRAMAGAIAHRGPDGEGTFCAPGIGLAHRRLAIVDLEGGRQPLGNEDGSVQVVFNGEIYNYRELRRELEARGHRFATDSDTENLVHLYEDLGDGLVERLRGMFAFALWDGARRRLLLARDRVGIKPLYYFQDGEKLLFGSELKAILAYGGVPREIDAAALEDYLALGATTGARTILRGIRKLPPGHVLAVEAGQPAPQPRRYWRLRFEPDESRSERDWQEAILQKVDESVGLHLIADVPVGAFLSGGIDSSVVTGLAARRSSGPIFTFSIGFNEARFDELPYARETAAAYGTRHVEETATADAASLLDKLCWHYDEPFADSSAIPTMMVSRLAARHVKAVLSGDGGDEAFGGYARYPHDMREAAVRNRLPGWFRQAVLGPLGRAWPRTDWLPRPLRAKSTLVNLALPAGAAYARTLSICRSPLRRELLAPDVVRGLNGHCPERSLAGVYDEFPGDPLARMLATDSATLLPDDFLVKVDRASMAYGLEVRPPLLDHELLELAATIPSRYKVRQGTTKRIFKDACRELLPPGLLARPKQGFEIPVDDWLRNDLAPMFREVVLAGNGPAADLLNLPRAAALFRRHRQGVSRHGATLWSLLVLGKWAERFLQAPAGQTVAPRGVPAAVT